MTYRAEIDAAGIFDRLRRWPMIEAVGIYFALKGSPTGGGDTTAATEKRIFVRWLFRLAPYLFLLTLAVLLSNALWQLLRTTAAALATGEAWPVQAFLLVPRWRRFWWRARWWSVASTTRERKEA